MLELQGVEALHGIREAQLMTYPYFHDAKAETLSEAVDVMSRLQLGKKFTAEENAQIVAFLKTPIGDQTSFQSPILPPSTVKTPAPKPFD